MILNEIVKDVYGQVAQSKAACPLSEIKAAAQAVSTCPPSFFSALKKEDCMSFICEVKKASPSKGLICADFDYLNIAKAYWQNGADAISVLTEPRFFKGDKKYLKEISASVDLPILRKDFIIDEYQIYEARVLGAAAVLLICAVLDDERLKSFFNLAHDLGMDCLVEAHDERELERALKAGARIIGVNNRNLKDFSVDFNNTLSLRPLAGKEAVFVSESGIKTHKDIEILRKNEVDAVLVGEALMRSADIGAALKTLKFG